MVEPYRYRCHNCQKQYPTQGELNAHIEAQQKYPTDTTHKKRSSRNK